MADLIPRMPYRPLIWPDFVLDLPEALDVDEPVYVVGGAVRDALLHRPIKDLDLAVARDGIRLARRIANAFKGDFFVLDGERDVGRALVDMPDGRLVIDVARFRGDGLLADLADRDFTINAMAVDLWDDPGLLIDPMGGEADSKDKVLRRCSPAAVSDDPIRALRAVRQSIQLRLRIEPETVRDVRVYGQRIVEVSPERVRDELVKILTLPRAAGALRVANALGLARLVVPQIAPLYDRTLSIRGKTVEAWGHTLAVMEYLGQIMAAFTLGRSDAPASFGIGSLVMQLDRYRPQLFDHMNTEWPNDRPHRALLMLAALLHEVDIPAAAEAGVALRLSNAEIDRLKSMLAQSGALFEQGEWDDLALHRFWYGRGAAGVDVCLLALADYMGSAGSEIEQGEWLSMVERVRVLLHAYYERYEQVVAPPPVIDGDQLMRALSLKPGPIIGALLNRIREAQVEGVVQFTDDALQIARTYLNKC